MDLIFSEECAIDDGRDAFFYDFAVAADFVCTRESVDSDICEVSITFESEDGIRDLNAKYREIDAVTDVLSFPMYSSKTELLDDISEIAEGAVISLGDVVICADVARRQAREYGHSERREMVYLFVHSLLHLFGYDHEYESERADMRAAEEDIMRQIGLPREDE